MQKTRNKNDDTNTVEHLKDKLMGRSKPITMPEAPVEPPKALKRAIKASNDTSETKSVKPGPDGNGIADPKFSNFKSDVYNYNRIKKITQITDVTKHVLLTELLDLWEQKHGKLNLPKS